MRNHLNEYQCKKITNMAVYNITMVHYRIKRFLTIHTNTIYTHNNAHLFCIYC